MKNEPDNSSGKEGNESSQATSTQVSAENSQDSDQVNPENQDSQEAQEEEKIPEKASKNTKSPVTPKSSRTAQLKTQSKAPSKPDQETEKKQKSDPATKAKSNSNRYRKFTAIAKKRDRDDEEEETIEAKRRRDEAQDEEIELTSEEKEMIDKYGGVTNFEGDLKYLLKERQVTRVKISAYEDRVNEGNVWHGKLQKNSKINRTFSMLQKGHTLKDGKYWTVISGKQSYDAKCSAFSDMNSQVLHRQSVGKNSREKLTCSVTLVNTTSAKMVGSYSPWPRRSWRKWVSFPFPPVKTKEEEKEDDNPPSKIQGKG